MYCVDEFVITGREDYTIDEVGHFKLATGIIILPERWAHVVVPGFSLFV
jgi:hypothetical protein